MSATAAAVYSSIINRNDEYTHTFVRKKDILTHPCIITPPKQRKGINLSLKEESVLIKELKEYASNIRGEVDERC